MIDHVSIGVRDLEAAAAFYDAVLAPLGFTRLYDLPETIGYGTGHPEFWLNLREDLAPVSQNNGIHICLRALTTEAVDGFHEAGTQSGGMDDGAPGLRPQYTPNYYAAFLRDPDGNKIEVVTFIEEGA
jgi:catechol 2,3-dioxygenase-like lactoylglutathione lyase family enzyme